MLEQASQTVAVPDTGSLRGDLLGAGPPLGGDPDLTRRRSRRPRRGGRGAGKSADGRREPAVLGRAPGTRQDDPAAGATTAARSERKHTHRPVVEALLGPLYFRLLVTGEALDDSYIEGIADLVCAACAPA